MTLDLPNGTTTLTKKLPCGKIVLAKLSRGYAEAKGFCNRTQAERAMAKLSDAGGCGYLWQPRLGPVFYVVVTGVCYPLSSIPADR